MLRALLGQSSTSKQGGQSQHAHNGGLSVRILTHNIRYATSSLSENEKPWDERFPVVMNQFSYHTRSLQGASFICMQEVLHRQLYDILRSLNHADGDRSKSPEDLPEGPLWAHVGVAREDGKTKGEYSPIPYPIRLFNLQHFENTWLSPTPDKPSKGWDAGSERILTTGVFEHKFTKRRLAVFNTHLDNTGTEARENSIAIMIDVIERVRAQWRVKTDGERLDTTSEGLEYFLAGDFNSFPSQEAYKAMVASQKIIDVHEAVPTAERYGSEVTFTGFRPDTDKDKDEIGRIDFIWLGPKSRVREAQLADSSTASRGWHVQGYSVLPNVFDDGIFSSDHRCVVADAVLLSD